MIHGEGMRHADARRGMNGYGYSDDKNPCNSRLHTASQRRLFSPPNPNLIFPAFGAGATSGNGAKRNDWRGLSGASVGLAYAGESSSVSRSLNETLALGRATPWE
jgi:hypothetical protein